MKISELRLNVDWIRADRYIVQGGYVKPAPGANLTIYPLFEEIQRPRKKQRQAYVPGIHEDLANLDVSNEEDLLEWVHNWGLLGVLPHRLDYAEFSNGLAFVQTPSGWAPQLIDTSSPAYRAAMRGEEFAMVGVPPGRAVLTEWPGSRKQFLEAADVFQRYFPDGMPDGGYPIPHTREFWSTYSESLNDIRQVIFTLRQVLHGLSVVEDIDHPTRDPVRGARHDAEMAQEWILTNARLRAEVLLGVKKEARSHVLSATSLIAAVATLTWMDWSEGKTFARCPICGDFYITNHAQGYCGKTCRKTAEMRRWRKNHPKAGDNA